MAHVPEITYWSLLLSAVGSPSVKSPKRIEPQQASFTRACLIQAMAAWGWLLLNHTSHHCAFVCPSVATCSEF